jgi:hypothetical protein
VVVEFLGGGAPAEGLAGRVLRVWAIAAMSSAVLHRDRSVPFGKFWRKRPLVFSFVPRCQGLLGSAKYTLTPEAIENWACADSSLPRSQVGDRRSCWGSVVIVCAGALLAV